MSRALPVRWRLSLAFAGLTVMLLAVVLLGVFELVRTLAPPGVSQPEVPAVEWDQAGDPVVDTGEVLQGERAAEGEQVQEVVEDVSSASVEQTMARLRMWSLAGVAVAGALGLAAGWFFAGRALRPVSSMAALARGFSGDARLERFRSAGPEDELKDLADTLDGLLDRVSASLEHERRLIATMAHELRTPLANEQLELEVALADPDVTVEELRESTAVALAQSRRASATVSGLLALARAEAGQEELRREPVDLAALVQNVLRGQDAGFDWQIALEEVSVAGDAALLRSAVENLVSNVVVHGDQDVPASVRLDVREGLACLVIANGGPELTQDEVTDLVLPFRRGARDRVASTGVGLGLSIVDAVARAHGGSLDLHARTPAGGSVEGQLALADSHGDTVATVPVPATGAAVGIEGWVDHDEYGNSATPRRPTVR